MRVTGIFQVGVVVTRCAAVTLSFVALSSSVANATSRPIIMLETAVTTLEERELFVRDTAPQVTSTTRKYFGRLFASLLPIKRYSGHAAASQIVTGAVGDRPSTTIPNEIPADPNFKRWEEDAKQRLKEENSVVDSKPHPLAAEHPESYVTVCEAGCPTNTDKIVYMVSRKEAANAQPRGFVPTSSEKDVDDKGNKVAENSGRAAEPIDPYAIDCVAGCYKGPKSMRALPDHTGSNSGSNTAKPRAEIAPHPAPAKASHKLARRIELMPKRQAVTTPAKIAAAKPIIAKDPATVRAKVQSIAKQIARKPAWRTKLVRETTATPEIKDKNWTAEARPAPAPSAKGKWRTDVYGTRAGSSVGRWKTKVARSTRVSMLAKKR